MVDVNGTATNTFDAGVSTVSLTMDYKFIGAATVGTMVVFAPYNADAVGVFATAVAPALLRHMQCVLQCVHVCFNSL